MKTHKSLFVMMIFVIGLIFSFIAVDTAKAEGTKPNQPSQLQDNPKGFSQPSESKVLVSPRIENVEYVMEALALSINRVNLSQENGVFDESDLYEDFNHFSYNKYQEVLQGKRKYRYLQFHTYWDDFSKDVPHIRVMVNIPDSEYNANDAQYLEEILQTLQNRYRVDISKLDKEQKEQIIRDIADGNRLTCVKSLRFAWALFTPAQSKNKQLFPEVFKLNISKAGELVEYVNNGRYLFSVPNVLQAAQLRKTIATNLTPSSRPSLFEGKLAVYFRPVLNSNDTGHVGIGWVNVNNTTKEETISFFEVNGDTGMAHYQRNASLQEFKIRLYNILPEAQSKGALIGWFINL